VTQDVVVVVVSGWENEVDTVEVCASVTVIVRAFVGV